MQRFVIRSRWSVGLAAMWVAALCGESGPCGAADLPDASTPKGAAAAFGQAVGAGDVEAAKKLVLGDAENQSTAEAFAKIASARKKLHEAATAKFGKDDITAAAGANRPGRPGASAAGGAAGGDPSEQLRDPSNLEEKVTGDTAIVYKTGQGEDKAVKLKKADGAWKLDVASLIPADNRPRAMQMIAVMAKVQGELAEEIKSDHYKTSDDAKTAYRQKVRDAVMSMIGGADGVKPPAK